MLQRLYPLLLASTLLTSAPAQDPTFGWAHSLGTIMSIQDCADDSDDRVIAVGMFSGSRDLDLGPAEHLLTPGQAGNTGFITAIQADGTMDWARAIGGTSSTNIYEVLTADDGSITVAGSFRGTVDLDPSASVQFPATANGTWDIFLARLDADGDFIWGFDLGNTFDEFSSSMALDGGGNLILGLFVRGTMDIDPGPAEVNVAGGSNGVGVLVKYDASGNYVWHNVMGVAFEVLGVLANGDIVSRHSFSNETVIGETPNTITVGEAGVTSNHAYVRSNAQGAPQQHVLFHGFNSFRSHVASDGSITIAGNYTNEIDLDPGTGTDIHTPGGFMDNFVIKLDDQWDLAWGVAWGDESSDEIEDLAVDGYGNVYLVAPLYGPYDVDPGPGEIILDHVLSFNAYLLILDHVDGHVRSAARLLGDDTGYIQIHGVAVTRDGTVLTYGHFRAAAPLDPWTNTTTLTVQAELSEEVFLCSFQQDIGLHTRDEDQKMGFRVYPVPCNEHLTVTGLSERVRYGIVDISGRMLMSGNIGNEQVILDVSSIPSGVYNLQLHGGAGVSSNRFIKQ
jgi:hypothetical protein